MLVLIIFFCYCAYTNIFYRPEWKFLEAGRLVTLDCLKGLRYKKKLKTTA